MRKKGDGEAFDPHPGDPWHPDWSREEDEEASLEIPEDASAEDRARFFRRFLGADAEEEAGEGDVDSSVEHVFEPLRPREEETEPDLEPDAAGGADEIEATEPEAATVEARGEEPAAGDEVADEEPAELVEPLSFEAESVTVVSDVAWDLGEGPVDPATEEAEHAAKVAAAYEAGVVAAVASVEDSLIAREARVAAEAAFLAESVEAGSAATAYEEAIGAEADAGEEFALGEERQIVSAAVFGEEAREGGEQAELFAATVAREVEVDEARVLEDETLSATDAVDREEAGEGAALAATNERALAEEAARRDAAYLEGELSDADVAFNRELDRERAETRNEQLARQAEEERRAAEARLERASALAADAVVHAPEWEEERQARRAATDAALAEEALVTAAAAEAAVTEADTDEVEYAEAVAPRPSLGEPTPAIAALAAATVIDATDEEAVEVLGPGVSAPAIAALATVGQPDPDEPVSSGRAPVPAPAIAALAAAAVVVSTADAAAIPSKRGWWRRFLARWTAAGAGGVLATADPGASDLEPVVFSDTNEDDVPGGQEDEETGELPYGDLPLEEQPVVVPGPAGNFDDWLGDEAGEIEEWVAYARGSAGPEPEEGEGMDAADAGEHEPDEPDEGEDEEEDEDTIEFYLEEIAAASGGEAPAHFAESETTIPSGDEAGWSVDDLEDIPASEEIDITDEIVVGRPGATAGEVAGDEQVAIVESAATVIAAGELLGEDEPREAPTEEPGEAAPTAEESLEPAADSGAATPGEVEEYPDFTEEEYLQAATREHADLAEAVERAAAEETEQIPVAADIPGLEAGVVGFDDVVEAEGTEVAAEAAPTSDLVTRVATGLLLLGAFVASLLWQPAIAVLALVVLGVAAGEFYTVLLRAHYQPVAIFGFAGIAGLFVGTWVWGVVAIPGALAVTIAVTLLFYALVRSRRDPLVNLGLTLLVVAWIGALGAFAFDIIASDNYRELVLAVVVMVAVIDTAQFFVGRTVGRRRLAPTISPNKTVEGLVGGVVVALLIGAGLSFFEPFDLLSGLAFGAAAAVFGPLGDLSVSVVKRSLGIKDMGVILPGHGGVLDRVDGLVFVIPAAWAVFSWAGLL